MSKKVFRAVLIAFSLGIVGMHVYAAFFPSGLNWGFHHLGFFPRWMLLLWLFLALGVFLPAVPSLLTKLTNRISSFVGRFPRRWEYAAIPVGSLLVFLAFRQEGHFLGDGRTIALLLLSDNPADIHENFQRAPLAGAIHWLTYHYVLMPLGIDDARLSFVALSFLSGVLFVWLVIVLARMFARERIEQLFVVGFILFSGTTQLFFGYVETYSITLSILLLFILLSLNYLRGKKVLPLTMVTFVTLSYLHFSMLFLLPALFYIMWVALRRERLTVVWSLSAAFVTAFILHYLLYLQFEDIRASSDALAATLGEQYLRVPMFGERYSLISWPHLVNVFNAFILVTPFGLILFLLVLLSRTVPFRDKEFVFLTLTWLGSVVLVLMVHSGIGASRDWDVLSLFIFPTVVIAAYLGLQSNLFTRPAYVPTIFLVLGISFLHFGAWISANASESRAAARLELLMNKNLWTDFALYEASTDLADYYDGQDQTNRTVGVFEKYVGDVPYDVRGYARLMASYRTLGMADSQMMRLKRAAAINLTDDELALLDRPHRYSRDYNRYGSRFRDLTGGYGRGYPRHY